jgi:hypothetical protein
MQAAIAEATREEAVAQAIQEGRDIPPEDEAMRKQRRPGRASVLKRYIKQGLAPKASLVFLSMRAFRWAGSVFRAVVLTHSSDAAATPGP